MQRARAAGAGHLLEHIPTVPQVKHERRGGLSDSVKSARGCHASGRGMWSPDASGHLKNEVAMRVAALWVSTCNGISPGLQIQIRTWFVVVPSKGT